MNLQSQLIALKPEMIAAAQKVYDEWEQDEEGLDIELGGGGICDQITQALADVIVSNIADVEIVDGGHEGDDHAYLIALDEDEACLVDIPASTYEMGGGYSWQKVPDVVFTPDDVIIAPVNREDVSLEYKIHAVLGLSEDYRTGRGQSRRGATQAALGANKGTYKGEYSKKDSWKRLKSPPSSEPKAPTTRLI